METFNPYLLGQKTDASLLAVMATYPEDDAKLQELAALRLTRPAFARMVSWEFGKEDYIKPASKKGGKKRHSSGQFGHNVKAADGPEGTGITDTQGATDDGGNGGGITDSDNDVLSDSYSSDSSVYFSAEESPQHDDDDDDVWVLHARSDETEAAAKSLHVGQRTSSQLPQTQLERKRRPSKKQRKKRVRVDYLSHAAPFKNVESLGVDLPYDCVQESVINLNKNVPSLVELCLRQNYHYQHCKGSSEEKPTSEVTSQRGGLPCGLRKLTSEYRNIEWLAGLQLAWLNRTLSLFNAWYKETNSMKNFIISQTSRKQVLKFAVRRLRNVWSMCGVNPGLRDERDALCKLNSSLPDTFMILDSTDGNFYKRNESIITSYLSHTIDLMLPATLTPRAGVRKLDQTTDQWMDTSMMTAISRVKRALSLRYPDLVDIGFKDALAYALWARGQVKKAAELFLHLSESAIKDNISYKAAHLNEAGRMYAQFGEEDMARKMFMRAAELCCQGQQDDYRQNLIGQAMMLVANQMDTGVFSPDNAKGALRAWDAVLKMYRVSDFAEEAAFVSMMCFHAGHYPSDSWLNEAAAKLQVWVERAPHLYLHLSMIHALNGDQLHSEATYEQFLRKNRVYDFDTIPGRLVNLRQRHTPWKPLVAMVMRHGRLPVIKLSWRVQMCHPVFSHESKGRVSVTDIPCRDLALHLDKDGYLTGNLQMWLPPIRCLHLDPFTGCLVFPSMPLHTGVWQLGKSTEKLDCQIQDHLLLPHQRQAFRDSSGRSVDLLVTRKLGLSHTGWSAGGNQTAVLTWHCPVTGHHVRLDLRKKIRQHMKQKIAVIIQESVEDVTKKKRQLEALDTFFSLGWVLSIKDIQSFAEQQEDTERYLIENARKLSNKRSAGILKRFKSRSLGLRKGSFSLYVTRYTQVGAMLVLQFSCNTDASEHQEIRLGDVVVMVNCDRRETFLAPGILWTPIRVDDPQVTSTAFSLSIPSDPSLLHAGKGEVFGVTESLRRRGGSDRTEKDKMLMYNTEGELLCELGPDCIPPTEADLPDEDAVLCSRLVLGANIYSVHPKTRARVVCDDLRKSSLSPIHYPFIKSLHIVGDRLLITTELGVSLVTATLQPVLINIKSERLCPVTVNDSGQYMFIEGQFEDVAVLGEKVVPSGTVGPVMRAAVRMGGFIVLMELRQPHSVDIIFAKELAGSPKEFYFISETAGFLVTGSLHTTTRAYYENLYHFDYDGRVRGLLPCLGVGPRSFFSFYHRGGETYTHRGEVPGDTGHALPGWYIYMRDGHGALCCFRVEG